MSCVHKENGNFDFTGGSFHFKFSFWHHLTLAMTSEHGWTMWDGAMLTGHCSDTDFASWFSCALGWKGFGSRGAAGWPLGEASRSMTHVQWSQCQWGQYEPTAGQG